MKIAILGSGFVSKNLEADLSIADSVKTVEVFKRPEFDLFDPETWFRILAFEPDYILNVAGMVGGIQANINNNYLSAKHNLRCALGFFDILDLIPSSRGLYFSSSCVMPCHVTEAVKPSDVDPRFFEKSNEGYAFAKYVGTQLSRLMAEDRCRTIIPSNLYGPHDPMAPEKSHLIAAIFKKFFDYEQNGRSTRIQVWGSGDVRREFLYIRDLTAAVELCLKNFESFPFEFNCGFGQDFLVKDFYKAIGRLFNYDDEFEFDSGKPEGIKRKLLDSTELRELGWVPFYGIDRGLRLTKEWYEKYEI